MASCSHERVTFNTGLRDLLRLNTVLFLPQGILCVEVDLMVVRHPMGPLSLPAVYKAFTLKLLCGLLGKAPGDYREVRLISSGQGPALEVGVAQTGGGLCHSIYPLGAEGLADALQQHGRFASGTNVSLSANSRQCIITQSA